MSDPAPVLSVAKPVSGNDDRLLLVEDRRGLREVVQKTLETEGYRVESCADGASAIRRLEKETFMLVLTDMKLPEADGLEVLRAARRYDPALPVIVMTAFGTIQDAVEAMKEGAHDFLEKPVDNDHLLALIQKGVEHRRLVQENLQLKERFAEELRYPRIIGESHSLRRAMAELRKVAGTEATVLLSGESGTGKELFARALHCLSARKEGPFFAINCAAIPENLLENELFGHERGAFTGAGGTKRGKIEMAGGGTLFLDEIGDLSPSLQGKLLRVIEDHCFERVGGTETRSVDLRLVAATNRDLNRLVEAGGFRQDLYFRLSVFPVTIPPLREREGDIPILARHFAQRFSAEAKRRLPATLAPETLEVLAAHRWPGNVRELENAIERAVILCEGESVRPCDLNLVAPSPAEPSQSIVDLVGLEGSLAEVASRAAALAEREKIRSALEETGGNKSRAAAHLKVSYKTLLSKLRDLGSSQPES